MSVVSHLVFSNQSPVEDVLRLRASHPAPRGKGPNSIRKWIDWRKHRIRGRTRVLQQTRTVIEVSRDLLEPSQRFLHPAYLRLTEDRLNLKSNCCTIDALREQVSKNFCSYSTLFNFCRRTSPELVAAIEAEPHKT